MVLDDHVQWKLNANLVISMLCSRWPRKHCSENESVMPCFKQEHKLSQEMIMQVNKANINLKHLGSKNEAWIAYLHVLSLSNFTKVQKAVNNL